MEITKAGLKFRISFDYHMMASRKDDNNLGILIDILEFWSNKKKMKVEGVSIRGNDFGNCSQQNFSTFKKLIETIMKNEDLSVLALNSNSLGDGNNINAVAFLTNAIENYKKTSGIFGLELNSNNFGIGFLKNINSIANMIKNNHYIDWLGLNSNKLGDANDYEGISLLTNALQECKRLSRLEMNSNNFGNASLENIKYISEIIKNHQSITSLALNSNSLGDGKNAEAIFTLCNAIESNKKISKLELNSNNFGNGNSENINHIIHMLNNNKNFIGLSFNSNSLGDGNNPEFISHLSNSLENKAKMTGLRLSANNLGNSRLENIKGIAKMIENNQYITRLALNSNSLGDGNSLESITLLTKAIQNNKTILRLEINSNNFANAKLENRKLFAEMFQKNELISTIYVDFQGCSKENIMKYFQVK